jgi:hypothetical protein
MAEEGFTGTNGSHGSFAEGIEVRSVVERYLYSRKSTSSNRSESFGFLRKYGLRSCYKPFLHMTSLVPYK